MLRCPHPEFLLSFLTCDQFDDWQEYFELEPWGDQRADLRSAALAVTLLGAFSGSDRLPAPMFPYFSGDAGEGVDLAGTADALEQHLERMEQALSARIVNADVNAVGARGSLSLTMQPGVNVTDQAEKV